jgi:predicted nucleotidyltransferase
MVTATQLNEIVKILVDECRPEKIILFGSYAQGIAKDDSDLDQAIIKKSNLPQHKRSAEFRKALRANGRRWYFGMDILVYTPEEIEAGKTFPHSFVHEILSTGKILYES